MASSSIQNRKRYKVKTTTGQEIELQSPAEQSLYIEARNKYLSENRFTIASDLRALDRLLLMEVQMYRWQWQLASGVDYWLTELDASDETVLRRSIKETTAQISQVQNDLGLTLSQRNADVDSVGAYIVTLKQRAKEFGVHRERQLGRALELMNEVISTVGAYQRSNSKERDKLGWNSAEDVLDWILEVVAPQYQAVDDHFRTHVQKYWHLEDRK